VREFSYEQLPGRVIFGPGCLDRIGEEVARLGARRTLLLGTKGGSRLLGRVAGLLGEAHAGTFGDVEPHVPIEAVRDARALAGALAADLVVTVGGGSTTGLGKALALDPGVPFLAVPTTYAGSEQTPIYGITADGVKRTGRDTRVLPRTVLYDPVLTLTLPPSVAGPSGMNALAHCVEALYAAEPNPITALKAAEGIRALAAGLPRVVADPADLGARGLALYGAFLAGSALANVGMAVHHRICHVLGGTFGLAHGDANAVVLPYAVAYNAAHAPEAMATLASALGVNDPVAGVHDLADRLGVPRSLAALGMAEADLDRAARLAAEPPPYNPRPVDVPGIRRLLEDAFQGSR